MTLVKDISQDLQPIQTREVSHWLLQLKAPCHYYPKSPLVKKHILDPISTLISYALNTKKIQSLSSCHYGSRYWQLKCTEEKSVHLLIENATEVNHFYEPWDILKIICRVSLPFSGISFSSYLLHHRQPRDPGICDFWGLVITAFTFVVRMCFFHSGKLQCLPVICLFGIQGWKQDRFKENPPSSCEPTNAVSHYKGVSKGKYLPRFRSNLKIIKRMLMFNILKY